MFAIIVLIFETIVKFLIAIVKFVLSILNYFGLTIPVFYFLLMFILNLILKGIIFETPLYRGLFYGGLGLCFLISIIYFVRKFFVVKKRTPPKFDFKRRRIATTAEETPFIPSGNIISERVFQDQHGNIIQERTFQMPENAANLRQAEKEGSAAINSSEVSPRLSLQKPQLTAVGYSNEEPEIYRVKSNKQYIIKEYSDRVEVYKETETGYDFVKCDYK